MFAIVRRFLRGLKGFEALHRLEGGLQGLESLKGASARRVRLLFGSRLIAEGDNVELAKGRS